MAFTLNRAYGTRTRASAAPCTLCAAVEAIQGTTQRHLCCLTTITTVTPLNPSDARKRHTCQACGIILH